ncbi:hypothetical protein [Phenylobacterium sp. J367]|uniref:hypothetical protein n=1 Tax=Phenylobacterium sp. J367 TaxID=2898435 RepID=UPI002150964F|nr:hypothetical protein [Phenylobacterium sp. J367]MCR5879093.1 hypothetical protein [Phenylobacterium sp. J367]
MTVKSDLRAVEYRTRAEAATSAAEASPLANQRELHEASAAVWNQLAEQEERRSVRAAQILVAQTPVVQPIAAEHSEPETPAAASAVVLEN